MGWIHPHRFDNVIRNKCAVLGGQPARAWAPVRMNNSGRTR